VQGTNNLGGRQLRVFPIAAAASADRDAVTAQPVPDGAELSRLAPVGEELRELWWVEAQ
jgi:hypothetical protein